MRLLQSLDRALVRVETALIVVFLSLMVLLAFLQVMLRNFLDTGLLWADPLVRHLVIWVGFVGAAVATHEERHISIDALSRFFAPRRKAAAHAVTSLFALVVCVFLADASWTFLKDELALGSEFMLNVPTWVALIIIPLGYAVIALHFAVKIVQHVLVLAGKIESAAS